MIDQEQLVDDLKAVVCSAAAAAKKFVGTGEKEAGDQAAVDAMRQAFEVAQMDGVVRVGEGEKDDAPMLYVGEKLGNGQGMKVDIAIDPVEGTSLMAAGKPNAIAVVAATDQGAFWDAGSAYYMNKIVVGPEAKGAIDINKSATENLQAIAKAKHKKVEDLVIYVLDKPRHVSLRQEIEAAGARVDLHAEGDVIGSVLALISDSEIDALMGIGGAPEAVITAAAVLALGGDMQGKLAPQQDEERQALLEEGCDLDRVLYLKDLVKSDWAVFAAAGVTAGLLLDEPKDSASGEMVVEYLVIGPEAGEIDNDFYALLTD
ncbi:class II fructose-bisphosphatase [Reichenbachiella carrageenanivorans]|uniref:Fructose-1,6-bisphosphatase n=1 Tax=Reichenbachiella carrageenanivorans TaxID=2979869 RepID=A0ABY6D5H0_9BACT|nr:class II fructose-bisphosphatase [Reichenbachiella carrageenanivorans]UXX81064.1 class II fructose-bisphosphatase [Reichenbachiella carrageenanivorans]